MSAENSNRLSLPKTRGELIAEWNAGRPLEFFLFYGHKPPTSGVDASCLSQWFVRTFVVDGVEYPTAEHWMMAEKARLFGDEAMLQNILDSDTPRAAKAFGRQVRDFDGAVWGDKCFEIVVQGNRHKFSQHADLRKFLLSTGIPSESMPGLSVAEMQAAYETRDSESAHEPEIYQFRPDDSSEREHAPAPLVILVEAAPRDQIWGIGFGPNNPKALDPTQWRGRNQLGFALTVVREEMAS